MSAALENWYPMLFPSERGPDACLQALAALTGGEPAPDPHVTLAYLTVPPVTEAQLAQLRTLAGPAVPIRAEAPYSLTEDPHPLFGYTLSLRVAPHPAFTWWRVAVRAILDPGGGPPQAYIPHMQAMRHMAVPPAAARDRLRGRDWSVAFEATTLIVSQRVGDTFVPRLEHHFGR